MQEFFKEVVNLAVFAPSGDNLQPWRFELGTNYIDVYSIETPPNLYDYKEHATLIAQGAVIENIVQIARAKGFETEVSLFPTPEEARHSARINFIKSDGANPLLLKAIRLRHTDRREYLNQPIGEDVLNNLRKISAGENVSIRLVEDKSKLKKLIDLLTVGDEMILLNKSLHSFFYDNVRWSDKEYEQSKDGMHIKSIVEKSSDVLMLKALKSWSLTKLLRPLGLPYLSYLTRRRVYRHTPLMAYLVIKAETRVSYMETGRALEALWLQATRHDLAVQPLSSVLFLYKVIQAKEPGLSEKEIKLISNQSRAVYDLLEVKEGVITFCIRMGYPKKPYNILRLRKDPEITT